MVLTVFHAQLSSGNPINGKEFLTAQIEYEEYSQEELMLFFNTEFETKILPQINFRKSYLVDNLNKHCFLMLR